MGEIFKKALPLSLLGHLALLSVFSFTFGAKIPLSNYPRISFLGQFLQRADLNQSLSNTGHTRKESVFFFRQQAIISRLDGAKEEYALNPSGYFKPAVSLISDPEKTAFLPKTEYLSLPRIRKEPSITFYPPLPYHFLLYFKDRQSVHIELSFKVLADKANSLVVKRKISSGNLEVDLLAMRYIEHYLFIQPGFIPPGDWQTVKIDLSPRDD